MYFDGGTKAWFGKSYRLVVRRSMLSIARFEGYSYGYELYLGIAAEREGSLPTVSRVWAVSSEELRKKEANQMPEPTGAVAPVAHR